uniref:Uncharacterized protein n=1 Tax=Musa acuminata subsp. malaccensis TaxID=214687 RepID=A0A804V5F2_MUSAM
MLSAVAIVIGQATARQATTTNA